MKTVVMKDQSRIESVIKSCKACFLGLCDANMQPYVIPMNFGYENGVIYLHGGVSGRKWSILETNPKACITFMTNVDLAWQDEQIACSWRVKSQSVVAEGVLEIVSDLNEKVKALDIIMAQYSSRPFKYSEPAIRNVGVLKMKIVQLGAKSFGEPGR